MFPYFGIIFSSVRGQYALSGQARLAVDRAANQLANLVGCRPEEVRWTSGGTEANNWAVNRLPDPALYLAGSSAAIAKNVKSFAGDVIPAKDYVHDLDALKRALDTKAYKALFVYVAQQDCGIMPDLKPMVELARKAGLVVHCDAVSALGKVKLDFSALDVDTMAVSAHKIHGPMGVGALIVRKGFELEAFMAGEDDQPNRAGTLPVPEVVGFGAAAEFSIGALDAVRALGKALRALEQTLGVVAGVKAVGANVDRLPTTSCLRIPKHVEFLARLAERNICVGGVSSAMTELGIDVTRLAALVRVSLSPTQSPNDITRLCAVMQNCLR